MCPFYDMGVVADIEATSGELRHFPFVIFAEMIAVFADQNIVAFVSVFGDVVLDPGGAMIRVDTSHL